MPAKPKTSGYVCIGGTCGRSDLGPDEVVNCIECRTLLCIDCAEWEWTDKYTTHEGYKDPLCQNCADDLAEQWWIDKARQSQ